MTHDVIMPALGMAQSTGRLVRWLKSPGEAVLAGEALFEVETDKTTMEVEAQANGFLGAVTAEAGDDVPVGQVIARILAQTDGAAPAASPVAPVPPSSAPAISAPSRPAHAIPTPPLAPPAILSSAPVGAPPGVALLAPQPGGGRILASPKARRLAAQEGLDLALLVQAGHPQPYHAVDLARLRTLSVPRHDAPRASPAPAPDIGPTPTLLHVAARASRGGSDAFLTRMRDEAGITLDQRALWLAFVAAAWRAALPVTGALVVECRQPGNAPTRWLDPDRARLSAQPDAGDAAPSLILRDLTGTCLTALSTGPGLVPVVTLADDGETLRLSVEAAGGALSAEVAQAFLSDLARRLADPLPYLV